MWIPCPWAMLVMPRPGALMTMMRNDVLVQYKWVADRVAALCLRLGL